MTTINIKAGLLQPVIQALGSFEGKKPVQLAVRLARVIKGISEYHRAWSEEHLRPAIEEFTGGETSVPDEKFGEFIKANQSLFDIDVPVELEPIQLSELLVDGLSISEQSIGLLMHTGVVID